MDVFDVATSLEGGTGEKRKVARVDGSVTLLALG